MREATDTLSLDREVEEALELAVESVRKVEVSGKQGVK